MCQIHLQPGRETVVAAQNFYHNNCCYDFLCWLNVMIRPHNNFLFSILRHENRLIGQVQSVLSYSHISDLKHSIPSLGAATFDISHDMELRNFIRNFTVYNLCSSICIAKLFLKNIDLSFVFVNHQSMRSYTCNGDHILGLVHQDGAALFALRRKDEKVLFIVPDKAIHFDSIVCFHAQIFLLTRRNCPFRAPRPTFLSYVCQSHQARGAAFVLVSS